MIEYHFKDVDNKGDYAVIHAENQNDLKAKFNKLQGFYPQCQFELVREICFDCESS